MKRILLATVATGCLAVLVALVGCSKPAEAPREVTGPPGDPRRDLRPLVERPDGTPPDVTPPDVTPPDVPVHDAQAKVVDTLVTRIVQPNDQDRYDAALAEALDHLADRHYNQALAALQTAQQAQDTELVRREIAKVTDLVAQQEAAEKTARDVQTVLTDGTPEEAADLGKKAVAQFGGGGDITDNLAQQKRQADTLVAAALPDDDARFTRFRAEGDEARTANNLRGASLAYEQALRFRDDAEVRRQFDGVQAALTRYDDALRRAARLRRDPAALEDALAALDEARQAWDTPQVRQTIDEYTFALQRRRDRVSVAEFEVRGDVGLPGAGRAVAEEMLPFFKPRFDLVEREQVGRVLDELRLEAGDLVASPDGQREVGRLARIRYLVVGSITPLNGVTAHARLVNVQTGVVEQTARVSAPSLAALMPRLRTLARVLQMSDDQKLAFEQALADEAAPVVAIRPIDPDRPVFAAPPPVPVVDVPLPPPPPPLVTYVPPPPNFFVGVEIGLFRRLPPVVVVDAPPPPPPAIEVVLERRDPRRGRLLALSVELGDDLFRRGRYREAQRHFSLAMTLSDGNADIALRVDRCRPFLPPPPPPPVVVVAPPPPVVVGVFPPPVYTPPPPVVVIAPPPAVRPRLIIFTFLLTTPPGLVPPNLGDWASDQFAAYFGPSYEIIDRGEVCWYMGRLGITFAQVMTDPGARIALAQALNARFYCFGTVVPTASLDVEAHLMDANSGNRTATGKIHVQDSEEMKLRLGELAQQLGATGDKGKAIAQTGAESEKALNEARGLLKAGKPAEAKAAAERGLAQAPDSAALRSLQAQADQQLKQAQLDEQRRAAEDVRLKNEAEAKAKREELAKASEAARLRSEAEAKGRTEAARKAEEQRKFAAAKQLQDAGNKDFAAGKFAEAVGNFKSAAALNPSQELFGKLAQAQSKLDEAERKKTADAALQKAEAEKKAREAALAKVEEEKRRRADDEKARQAARDKEVAGLVASARKELAAKDYGKALAAAQSAQQLSHTPETEKLLEEIRHEQTLASAKSDEARRAAEKKQAEEKARQDRYQQQLKLAGESVQVKKYDDAIGHFKEAQKLFNTDVVLTGLKQAEDLKARAQADADKEQLARAAEAKRAAEVKRLLGEGQNLVAAAKFAEALKSYDEALKYSPGNVEVLTARGKAEKARDDYTAKNRAKLEEEQRAAAAKKERHGALLQQARAAVAAKKYDDATNILTQANQLLPDDPSAKALAADVARGKDQLAAAEKVHTLVAGARKSIALKDFVNAEKTLAEAVRLAPSDPDVIAARDELTKAKPKPLDPRVKADYDLAMGAARSAMKSLNYTGAVNSATEALRLIPGDPSATALLKDAQAGKADADRRAKADYAAAIQAGRAALAVKKYDDAIKDANDALKLVPNDPAALALLKDAQAGKVGTDTEAKRKADYAAAIQAGRTALAAKKYDDAIRDAGDALKLVPNDPAALALLKDAETGKTGSLTDTKKREDYQRLMTGAQQALAAKRYDEAARMAGDALKLFPNDPTATRVVKDANDGIKVEADRKRQADYAAWMQAAKAALAAKKYDDAIKDAGEALKLFPGDAAATGIVKDAQAGKAGTDTEAKRKADYAAAIQAARTALSAKKYDEAIKDASDALKLMPNDPAALALLKDAQAGKAGADTDAKRKADYAAAIQAARTALSAKKYDEAIKDASDALRLFPGDPLATGLLKDAQTGKAGADVEKKKAADYQAALQAGRTALTAKRYDDAIKDAQDALKLFPGDPTATQLLRDAQTGKAGADVEKKKAADYQAAIQAGRVALAGKRFDDAIRDASDALKLFPGDPTATALLRDAQAGKAGADAEAKRKADYNAQMALGQQAMATKRYADAIKAYTEALRLMPGDAAATKGLADAKAADKPPPPPPPPAPDYNKSIQSAQAFEKQKAWAAAATAYRDALKAKPGDAKATFGAAMAEGQQALDAKRWADAQKSFEDALKVLPNDADAKALLKRAKDMK